MKIFIADINVNNEIVKEEVESKDLQEAKEYFDNFLKYWSKVWFGWKGSFIVKIYEKDAIKN